MVKLKCTECSYQKYLKGNTVVICPKCGRRDKLVCGILRGDSHNV